MTIILFHSFCFPVSTNNSAVLILVIVEGVIVDVKLCNASRSSTIQKFLKSQVSDKNIHTNQTSYFDAQTQIKAIPLETNPIQGWEDICHII